MSAQEGGEVDGARAKGAVAGGGWAAGAGCSTGCGAEGNPAKLKLCRTRGGRWKRAEGGGGGAWTLLEEEVEEDEEEDLE